MAEETVWYVAIAGQQQGPFPQSEVVRKIQSGAVGPDAHVFATGMDNWVPITSRPEFSGAFSGAPAPPSAGGIAPTAGAQSAAAAAGGAHEIDYQVYGEELQFVEITLDPGEACIAEAGAFMYMDPGIEMNTIFGDGSAQSETGGFMGKLMSAGKRVLTGESLFMTVFGNGSTQRQDVAFASPYPGKIIAVDLREHGRALRHGEWLQLHGRHCRQGSPERVKRGTMGREPRGGGGDGRDVRGIPGQGARAPVRVG